MSRRFVGLALLLLFCPLALGLRCYIGTEGQNPVEQNCASGNCGYEIQEGKGAFRCFSSLQCSGKFCCQEDRCNSPFQSYSPPVPVAQSNAYPWARNLVGFASEWKYFVADGSGPGATWIQTSFDDGAWSTGRAPFGSSNETNPFLTTQPTYSASVVTMYFRTTFNVDSATKNTIQRLLANLIFDDGVIIYINGNEVHRYGFAAVPNILYNTPAILSETAYKEEPITIELNNTYLVTGMNTLAVEVHRANPVSPPDVDLSMALELNALVPSNRTFPRVQSTVQKGSSWYYVTSGDLSIFGSDWKTNTLTFNLSSWSVGPSPFGDSAANNIATTLSYTENPVPLTYFRQIATFAPNSVNLEAYVRSDNGFVLYIDGNEVLRHNLPQGVLTATSTSEAPARLSHKDQYYYYPKITPNVISGQKVVSVIVFHESGEATPNISFDIEILATIPQPTCTSFDANMETTGSFPRHYLAERVPCVFPFVYNNVTYQSCTSVDRSQPWCSLTSNYDIDGLWGYCNPCVALKTDCKTGCNQVGNRLVPTCFTNLDTKEWGYCNIWEKYTDPTTSGPSPTLPPTTPAPTELNSNHGPAIGGALGGVASLILIGLGVYFYLERKKERKLKRDIENLIAAKTTNSGQAVTMQVASYQSLVPPEKKNPFPNFNPGDYDMEGRTLMNTTMEKALPGFLQLTDLASQIRIGRVINKGGNGILYEGAIVDPNLKSRAPSEAVAVKKIEYSQPPEEAIEAFHHEITAMWSLSFHPNVITLIAYDDATTSIVTPLYDGDLEYYLHKNPQKLALDDRMLIYLAYSIAKGMSGIHDAGIIHRDLKPGNILLKFHENSLPEVVLCDFGIAKIADNHTIVNQKKYELFGLSPRYAAPETFARMYTKNSAPVTPDIERLADVFSYSVILWELLSKKVPWDGLNAGDIELNVRAGKFPPDPPLGSPVRSGLDALMKNCRSLEPKMRLSFGTIVQRLAVFAEQVGISIS